MRYGAQTPRVRHSPTYVTTLGPEVADLMTDVGKPLLPYQCEYMNDSLGRRADGKWSSYESGIFEARQNGKGVVMEARELYSLFILRTRRVIHSAHLFDTSREAFERLVEIIEGSDWLSKRVQQINRAHGKEGITLTRQMGGGALKYKARTLHGARGFSGEEIHLDEAYALVKGHYAAISPILATLPNPSIHYYSSPPDEKIGPMPEDSFLPSVRKRGLGGDPRMTYWEFSPEEDFDLADVDVWYATNPALGYLISEEYLADQHRVFIAAGSPSNFGTEHLGVWPGDEGNRWRVISKTQWTEARGKTKIEHDPVVLALDATPDRKSACLAVAGARPSGDVGVSLIEHAPGTDWCVARVIREINEFGPIRLVINAFGAAASLLPDIEREIDRIGLEVEVISPNAPEESIAYGCVYDALTRPDDPDREGVAEGARPWRLWHTGDKALTTAVGAADTRKVGHEGTTWAWSDTIDMSPLKAVTHAVWGLVTRPPDFNIEDLVSWR